MDGVVSRGVPRARVERALRRLMPLYFWGLWWITLGIGYFFYQERSTIVFGDWLINYRGGWVRRGLLGEAILWLAQRFSCSPGGIVLGLWGLLYALLLGLAYWLLKRQTHQWPWAFAVFSPFLFAFPLNLPYEEFLRKELLYHVLLFGLAVASLRCDDRCLRKFFQGTVYLFPLLLLSHEALILYLPYLFALFLRRIEAPQKGRELILPVLLNLLALGMALSGRSLPPQAVEHIRSSIAQAGFPLRTSSYLDPLGALTWRATEVRTIWRWALGYFHIPLWCLVALPLSLAAFWPVRHRLRYLAQDRWVRWLVGLSLLGTVVLFTVAVDWGRFLRIHLMSWFALALSVPTRRGEPWPQEAAPEPIPVWQLALLVLYALGWRLGFQCKIFPSFFIQLTWPLWHR